MHGSDQQQSFTLQLLKPTSQSSEALNLEAKVIFPHTKPRTPGCVIFRLDPPQLVVVQGSLHFSPAHCLVNCGFPLSWWKKQHVSNGCKMYLLRSPVLLWFSFKATEKKGGNPGSPPALGTENPAASATASAGSSAASPGGKKSGTRPDVAMG